MAGGDLAQALEVAFGRDEHAGRSGDRLDDHRGDGLGAVQVHEPLQVVSQLVARLALAAGEGRAAPWV